MWLYRYVVNLEKKDDVVNIRPIGDVHIGNIGWQKDKFERCIDEVAKDDSLHTIGMGDYIDNIMAWAQGGIDKRYNPETMERDKMTTEEQIAYFVRQWSKVAHKSIGLHSGNHEWKTVTQRRFVKDFCNPVDFDTGMEEVDGKHTAKFEPVLDPRTGKGTVLYHNRYLGRMSLGTVVCKYKGRDVHAYNIFSHHGGYSGIKIGGAINRLQDLSGGFRFDIALMGHSHDTAVVTQPFMDYDRKHNKQVIKKQILGNTGTFLESYAKGVDNYGEIAPRRPKMVGTITITLVPETGGMYGHD